MEGFDKIKNIKLSDLDAENTLEDQLYPEKKEEKNQKSADTADNREERTPVGRHYVIDAKITESELRSFRLNHEYRRPLIILVNLAAIFFVLYAAFTKTQGKNFGMTIGIACFLIIYYPLIIIFRTRTLMKTSKVFQQTFHYLLDEEGLHLKLEKEAVDVEWKYIRKLMILKSSVVVYTGKHNAWIIPTKDMGDQKEEIIAFLKEKTQTGK